MSDVLYFPVAAQRAAVDMVLGSPGGGRFREHARDMGRWLQLDVPASLELSLSSGERLVLDFLRGLAGHGPLSPWDMLNRLDTATFKACYRAYGELLRFAEEGATPTPGPAPVGGAA